MITAGYCLSISSTRVCSTPKKASIFFGDLYMGKISGQSSKCKVKIVECIALIASASHESSAADDCPVARYVTPLLATMPCRPSSSTTRADKRRAEWRLPSRWLVRQMSDGFFDANQPLSLVPSIGDGSAWRRVIL